MAYVYAAYTDEGTGTMAGLLEGVTIYTAYENTGAAEKMIVFFETGATGKPGTGTDTPGVQVYLTAADALALFTALETAANYDKAAIANLAALRAACPALGYIVDVLADASMF